MKKIIWMFLLCFVLLIIPSKTLYADESFAISKLNHSLVFDKYKEDCLYAIYSDKEDVEFVKGESSNNKVVTVEIEDGELNVEPVGKGTCNVTVTDEDGSTEVIKVTVTENYYKGYIEDELDQVTYIDRHWYGSRKLFIHTLSNCKGSIKIGKDTYKFTIGSSGEKYVKLKKTYKLNQKVYLMIEKDGVKFTTWEEISSNTYSVRVKGSKKKLKVYFLNLHKGDVITVKHRGKTYTKKIKKNYDCKKKAFTFRTRKKVRKNGDEIKVTIKNKSKKKLDSNYYTLRNGSCDRDDDDDDDQP